MKKNQRTIDFKRTSERRQYNVKPCADNERRSDCLSYDTCLSAAAHVNAKTVGCFSCARYKAESHLSHEMTIDFLSLRACIASNVSVERFKLSFLASESELKERRRRQRIKLKGLPN